MTEQQRERFAEALKRLGGDEETLTMMASIASEDAPVLIERWGNQLQREELHEYAKTGHSLKGLLSTFETGEPISKIQPLIDDARRNELLAVQSAHALVLPELSRFLGEISELV
jgi:hypothetical protein